MDAKFDVPASYSLAIQRVGQRKMHDHLYPRQTESPRENKIFIYSMAHEKIPYPRRSTAVMIFSCVLVVKLPNNYYKATVDYPIQCWAQA